MVIFEKLHDTLPNERKQGADEYIYHATIMKTMGEIIYIYLLIFSRRFFCKDIPQEYREWLPTGDEGN